MSLEARSPKRSLRSTSLAILSLCGSLAAAVWLVGADAAFAETSKTELSTKQRIPTTVENTKLTEEKKTDTPPPVKKLKKKKRIDVGEFEGY